MADTESLATRQYPLGYVLNFKLTNPADAENFATGSTQAATPTRPAAFTSSRGR
jgi:hypothetical protein